MSDDDAGMDCKISEGGAVVDHGFVGVVETAWREEMREVRTAATSGTQVLGEATAVHDGLQSVVHAVRKGSVPLFQAAFEAIAAKLDGGQLATAFADGVPCRNSKLLLLAAEGGNQELFEAVLRVLDRVAKVSVASKTNERGEQELTGRRTGGGVSPQSTSHREGTATDFTLLQAIYSGDPRAVTAWAQTTRSTTQRAVELVQYHAGRSPVMHAALVGDAALVLEVLNAMRAVGDPLEVPEEALVNSTAHTSLLFSAAQGGNQEVFNEVMRLGGSRQLLGFFLKTRDFGRAALIDAAVNGGPKLFRAVTEILDKPLRENQAIKMIQESTFDGNGDDDLQVSFTPNRHVVEARVAALSHVLPSDRMAQASAACLENELSELGLGTSSRASSRDRWPGRLSFLLACGAEIVTGKDGNLSSILGGFGVLELQTCFIRAISAVDNPFIPGMMLAVALVSAAPTAKENEKRKMSELQETIEELLLEVLERLPQAVAGFPGGAAACSYLFEPETTGATVSKVVGPLRRAFSKRRLITTFCTQPLVLDFITHTFGAGLLSLEARGRSDKQASGSHAGQLALNTVDPAVVATTSLATELQQVRPTLLPGVQFILVGLVAMPFTYYRVPLLRMALDLVVYLVVLAVYTIVIANMYAKSLANRYEIALGFYVVAAIMTEISAFGRSSREYYRDKWNWLDIPALFLLATGFVVRLADALGPDDHTDNVGEALYLLSAPLLFARVLFFAQIHPAQGAMIEVMIRMVGMVLRFGAVMVVVMMGFAVSFWASRERFRDPSASDDDDSFDLVWVGVFKAMLGDFEDVEYLNSNPDWVDRVLFVSYLVVMAVMLLNLLIAVLSTAHASMEEHAQTETKASKVRVMEHYRRVVENDMLPAPFNLVQVVALFPIKVVDFCINRGLYKRLKPTVGRIMGSFVFWLASGPVAIALGFLLWIFSIPTTVIKTWEDEAPFWVNISRCAAVIRDNVIFIPLALTWLWVLGAAAGARKVVDLTRVRRLPTSNSLSVVQSGMPSSIGEMLLKISGGLSVHQLSVCLEDPMSDPEVRRDEQNRPTTVKHIKLLRSRLEATGADRVAKLGARVENALNARDGNLEDRIIARVAKTVNERANELEKRIEEKINDMLRKFDL